MNDTFVPKREKESRPFHPNTSMCFLRTVLDTLHYTYKENVVKNEEPSQVCDHFFSYS